MFNLRFKCTVISSWHMVLHAVPKANKMIANKNRYSETERFVYAKWIINYMRKHAEQEPGCMAEKIFQRTAIT